MIQNIYCLITAYCPFSMKWIPSDGAMIQRIKDVHVFSGLRTLLYYLQQNFQRIWKMTTSFR